MLLEVENLVVEHQTRDEKRLLLHGVSWNLERGEVVGLAGESGSGKSITALGLLRLLPASMTVSGAVRFDGADLLTCSKRHLASTRGARIAYVAQDPTSYLHPLLTVETLLTEHLREHLGMSATLATKRAVELLAEVQIPNPEGTLRLRPWQISGGMRQRLSIAIALACEPDILIADEPTTALDVTVQAGLIHLLSRLRSERGLAILLITHDLGVLSALADRVVVMLQGRIVEEGSRQQILTRPKHPYVQALVSASVGRPTAVDGARPLRSSGLCAYDDRCPHVAEACIEDGPIRIQLREGGNILCRPEWVGKA